MGMTVRWRREVRANPPLNHEQKLRRNPELLEYYAVAGRIMWGSAPLNPYSSLKLGLIAWHQGKWYGLIKRPYEKSPLQIAIIKPSRMQDEV